MPLNDIRHEHVLQAIEECNQCGRDKFLEKYGFYKSINIWLVHNGQSYDSKAIVGVAHGYARPDLGPLTSGDFSGGVVLKTRLKRLGFSVKHANDDRKPLWTAPREVIDEEQVSSKRDDETGFASFHIPSPAAGQDDEAALSGFQAPVSAFRLKEQDSPGKTAADTKPEPTVIQTARTRSGTSFSLTDSAQMVLEQFADGRPMHYREVAEKALEMGWFSTEDKTPEASMFMRILREIERSERRGEQPRFTRDGQGFIGLSKWTATDLADFRMPEPAIEESRTGNEERGKWVGGDGTVNVGGIEIKGGFFYVGGQLSGLGGYGTEPSLVDPTLAINVSSPDYRGEQVPYGCSYDDISPESRAAYVKWLAGDRGDPEVHMGYIFLYFSGIERRLLVDDENGAIPGHERDALILELRRLKNLYGYDRYFNGYVTNLLSHAWVLNHKNDSSRPSADLLVAEKEFTSAFQFLLSSAVKEGSPVDRELALAWVKTHPDFSLRTSARRCEKEFDALFKLRYKNEFGDGLEIETKTTGLQLRYRLANSSLRGYQGIKLDLPDVSRLKRPIKKLMDLAESCTNEIESFSRFVGRPGNFPDSLYAVFLLPGDLVASGSYARLNRLRAWMGTQVSESDGLVSMKSILQHFGEDAPEKIDKKQADMLSNVTEKAGFGIVPDARFHGTRPDIDGKVVLFAGGHGDDFSPSPTFRKIATILRLGALVARIDEHVDEAEVSLLQNLITENGQLTEIEKRSLYAYMYWRLNTPANMSGLKKRLEVLDSKEKIAISHILVGVALADGKIAPAEIKQLEKLYTSLGLDRSMVTSDVYTLSSSRMPTPAVREQEVLPQNPFEAPRPAAASSLSLDPTEPATPPTQEEESSSPNPLEAPKPAKASSFSLDSNLLKWYEEETKNVQAKLETIFVDEDVLYEPEKETTTDTPQSDNPIQRLDTRHRHLYRELVTKKTWSSEEIEELCENLQLMVSGAIEVMNDWAYENFNSPLIEDDDKVIHINPEVAEEMSILQTRRH